MFLVRAGTVIQVQVPKSSRWFHWNSWMPWTTSEDRLYDKHQVWDAVAVHNERADIPDWARRNIVEFNRVVIQCANKQGQIKYALVNPQDITFVD